MFRLKLETEIAISKHIFRDLICSKVYLLIDHSFKETMIALDCINKIRAELCPLQYCE